MDANQLAVAGAAIKRHENNLLKLLVFGFLFWSLGAQAQTVYQLDRTVGSGTVIGTIETDGTIGPLTPSNILSWSLEADDASGAHPPIIISSELGGGMTGAGWDYFSATESELLFDFVGAYDFASASGLFADVQFFGDGGAIDESINYGFAASPEGDYGKKENLAHFFPDGFHYVESLRDGVMVVGTTGNGNARESQVVYSVHVGGPDICEALGFPTGCDANNSGSAVLRADGRVTGQFIDTFAGGGAGVHWTADCLHVAGNDAWISGVIKHGATPNGFDLTGFPIVIRVRDNGVTANDPSDAISFGQIGNPTPCYMEPDLNLFDYVHGQVKIK
jgi:hypothetical protein